MIHPDPTILDLYSRLDSTCDPIELMRRTAYHEAGHAIVAAVFSYRLGQATIRPELDDKKFGSVSMGDPLSTWQRGDGPRRKLARDHVTVLFAGAASEAIHFGSLLVPTDGDDEDAFEVIRQYGIRSGNWWSDGVIERVEASWRKRSLLLVRRYSQPIERFAQTLLSKVTLSPEQVTQLAYSHLQG